MKILFLAFALLSFTAVLAVDKRDSENKIPSLRTDTVSVAGQSLVICNQAKCKESFKAKALAFKNIIVLYKKTSGSKGWDIAKEYDKAKILIAKYDGSEIRIYEGALRLHGSPVHGVDAIVSLD